MTAMPPINPHTLETALEDYVAHATGEFAREDLQATMLSKLELGDDYAAEMSRELDYILNYQPLFTIPGSNKYTPKHTFFLDSRFIIRPSVYEIAEKILIPGHRFAVFCDIDIFPSEVELVCAGDADKLGLRTVECPLEQAVQYYNLLGPEEMFQYLVADHMDNQEAISAFNPDAKVKLSVFDMADFYSHNDFSDGDCLLCRVEDWDLGKFTCEYLPKTQRDASETADWTELYEDAIIDVLDRESDYMDIPQQLANAFFVGDSSLLGNPQSSLDEFQLDTRRIQLRMVGGHSTLAVDYGEGSDEEEDSLEVPEGVCISQGKTGSLNEILKEIGCLISQVELESFMLDEVYRGSGSFEAFFSRCFGQGLQSRFLDAAQEAVFMNFLEDRWERLVDGYDFATDGQKGDLRIKILEIVEERCQWLEQFAGENIDTSSIPKDKMETLAKGTTHLEGLLNLLNKQGHRLEPDEVDQYLDAIEQFAELQQELIESIDESLRK